MFAPGFDIFVTLQNTYSSSYTPEVTFFFQVNISCAIQDLLHYTHCFPGAPFPRDSHINICCAAGMQSNKVILAFRMKI